MSKNVINEINSLLKQIKITAKNRDDIAQVKQYLIQQDFDSAVNILRKLVNGNDVEVEKKDKPKKQKVKEKIKEEDEEPNIDSQFPKKLQNNQLEKAFIGLLLSNPKAISMYYFLFEDCYFDNSRYLNIYKSVLFTEGQEFAPEIAKQGFNFPKEEKDEFEVKQSLKNSILNKTLNFEEVYTELKKLFILRKSFLHMPIKETQDTIMDIINYKLYDKMTSQEVEDAVNQIIITSKFKKAVLNDKLTDFLLKGDNNLTNGLSLPFPILSSVFKGMRKGETMTFAMPSNAGKSRFTINLAAYIAFVHKKKVLIISNEMSEEKVRLCLATTIINNPEIQKLHGQEIRVNESELLAMQYRPDNPKDVKVDKDGYILREKDESQKSFIERLNKYSSDFRKVTQATDWLNKEVKNSIYFANITDHTNDELQKIIMNYYYKEQMEYVFYDTLKTDTANIGNGEELKKTTTILSNLAQNFSLFIGATIQLLDNQTLPVNLTVNDLSVSKTIKEVLDTLSLVKQIHNDYLDDYEYSEVEVSDDYKDLERFKDPDVRYYVCVVDKNRAGAKPKVLFRLNLAYNRWEELGYVRLKQKSKNGSF